MTKLISKLNQHLNQNLTQAVIKDENFQGWFTGQDILDDIKTVRNRFINLNVRKNDHVLVCLENSAIYTVLEQALWEIGAIVHPISATIPLPELQRQFNEFDYVMLIAKNEWTKDINDDSYLKRVDLKLKTAVELPVFIDTKRLTERTQLVSPNLNENSLALVLQTSGTTGKPKQVGLTHGMLFNAAEHNIHAQNITSRDTTMVIMPMFHINAQVISILSTRLSGGKLVIFKKISARNFWQQISDYQVT